MKKRLLKVAVATALTVAFAVPAFANPFKDVPAKHWAYDAVNKLVQAGIVDGFGDGTFRGEKTVTRYEMAQIVAKAMTKSLNADQQATVNQLSKEFAAELNNLGVKVDGIQKQLDNAVKISGDARVRYTDTENNNGMDARARITFDGKINDSIKWNARLTTGNFDPRLSTNPSIALNTANVSFNTYGLNNTVGRQDIKFGSGFLMDSQFTGITSKYNGLKLFAGNIKAGSAAEERIYAAEYGMNILGAKVVADYYKNDTNDDEIYGANASFGLTKNVSASAEYFKNNTNDATAAAYGVKFDKLGLSATYRDVEAGAFTAYSTMKADLLPVSGSFKGMEYQLDRNIAKNTTLTVKYQDFDNMPARAAGVVSIKY